MEKGVFMVEGDVGQSWGLRLADLERIPKALRWPAQLTTCQPPVPVARSSQFLELKEARLKNQQENEDEKIRLERILGCLVTNVSLLNPH